MITPMQAASIAIVNDQDSPAGDEELERLLLLVYVDAGFTEPHLAPTAFAASALRDRGQLYLARDTADQSLVGMVIVVPPSSPAKHLAADNEAEMHLLAVAPKQRGSGVGRQLVEAAMQAAQSLKLARMVLWTQPAMEPAQRLYERTGFVRAPARDWSGGGRDFLVYERAL